MTVFKSREAFIPYSRQEIVDLCLADGKIAIAEQDDFREFCEILIAYYHFKLHRSLETLKSSFCPLNPDISDYESGKLLSSAKLKQQEDELITTFTSILQRANYFPVPKRELQKALEEDSLFDLKTDVDFNAFERMICYCRGDDSINITVKKWGFRSVQQKIDIYQRVVLLIKFKDEQHYSDKPAADNELSFKPGKIYLYLYKNLSKLDLEFIFPNIEMSMTWKDRLMFGVPAIGAAIPLALKTLPQLILVAGVLLYFVLGYQPIDELRVQEEDINNIAPLIITILSLTIALGGFAFRQFTNYKNKQIRFQKNVTETLFYRNMANNSGVFQYLIDAAEEEECKEIILVYYHLLTSEYALTPSQLDHLIESWMLKKFGKVIDFDIEKTLRNLSEIKINYEEAQGSSYRNQQRALLKRDRHNRCHILPLQEAKQILDHIWDRIFEYS
ncbi:MAG: TMEM143 family protein [Cyanobacteria bacterium P01_C01_bin.72]